MFIKNSNSCFRQISRRKRSLQQNPTGNGNYVSRNTRDECLAMMLSRTCENNIYFKRDTL